MAQIKVPKFIDIEDRIIGPLTLRQFTYIAIASSFGFFFFILIPLPFSVFFSAGCLGLGIALAFVKVNERPFHQFLIAALRLYISPTRYVWQKTAEPSVRIAAKKKPEVEQKAKAAAKNALWTTGKIRELAEKLDREEYVRRRDL